MGTDLYRKCESCGASYQGPPQGGCGYCVGCCLRWHFGELTQGATIHTGEAQGQAGR